MVKYQNIGRKAILSIFIMRKVMHYVEGIIHRGLKLFEHDVKVLEQVVKKHIRSIMKTNDMSLGFMQGHGTTDYILI